MSEGLNKVMLLGGLGADPEMRFSQAGQAVMRLRLATDESYVDRDQNRQTRTEWHTVIVFGKRAEGLAKILVKGSRVMVEGRIASRSYDDKDGQKRYVFEIIAQDVYLAGGTRKASEQGAEPRRENKPAPQQQRQQQPQAPREPEYGSDITGGGYGGGGGGDDDIPFASSAIERDPMLSRLT
jgi:single-strand DNA-binding protein